MSKPTSNIQHLASNRNRDRALVGALLLVPEPVVGQQKGLANALPAALAEGIAHIKLLSLNLTWLNNNKGCKLGLDYLIMDKAKILERCNNLTRNTLMETLNIEYVDLGNDFLIAKMPVNERVHQPMGLLHGGASVALAESVGSAASMIFVDIDKYEVRGIEISANHIKSKREGFVFAKASLIHKGSKLHLWEIRITDENNQLISLCKLTNMILPK